MVAFGIPNLWCYWKNMVGRSRLATDLFTRYQTLIGKLKLFQFCASDITAIFVLLIIMIFSFRRLPARYLRRIAQSIWQPDRRRSWKLQIATYFWSRKQLLFTACVFGWVRNASASPMVEKLVVAGVRRRMIWPVTLCWDCAMQLQ